MNDIKRYSLLFLVVLIGVIFEREAKAYTDPGSGILLWQVHVMASTCAGFLSRAYSMCDVL